MTIKLGHAAGPFDTIAVRERNGATTSYPLRNVTTLDMDLQRGRVFLGFTDGGSWTYTDVLDVDIETDR